MDLKEAAVINLGRMAAAVVGFSDGRDGKPQMAVGASPAQTNDPFAEWRGSPFRWFDLARKLSPST